MERNNADPRVDAYIHALPAWQQGICEKVRDLVHAADSEVRETIKRTRQPYFVLHGNICALLAARKWVNVFLYDGGIVPDPHLHHHGRARQQDGPHSGDPEGGTINERALTAMFRRIIANNRKGGWRTLKARRPRR